MKMNRIKISLDQAIRVEIPRQKIQLNVSNSAKAASLLHPNGRILQDQDSSRVDIVAFDGNGKNNYVSVICHLIHFSLV